MLIRHADYVPSTNGDPGLSPAGQARAQTLVHVLGGTGIDHIIVSQWARTQQTAAPLETHLGIGYQVIEALHRAAILTAIRAQPSGGTVLFVGHSNTVPDLVTALTGVTGPPITGAEFDNLLVVTGGQLLRLRYGNPS